MKDIAVKKKKLLYSGVYFKTSKCLTYAMFKISFDVDLLCVSSEN